MSLCGLSLPVTEWGILGKVYALLSAMVRFTLYEQRFLIIVVTVVIVHHQQFALFTRLSEALFRKFHNTMEHLLIRPDHAGLLKAAELIKSGDLVAFPTETVYGLGANALNEQAVKSIFVAKGRPLTDPLIVHIAESEQAYELVELQESELPIFDTLVANFWPGPLTIIVKASSKIPLLVTADTGFVGVRCPKHPLAVALIAASGLPIAAPSANRFGHVSPTTALHVLADLGEKGVHVLNGEYKEIDNTTQGAFDNCEFGIESSVVKIDAANEQLIIFRQGAVSQLQLEQCLRSIGSTWKVVAVQRAVKMHSAEHADGSASASIETAEVQSEEEKEQEVAAGQQAPGQAITHYAPDVPCFIVNSLCMHLQESREADLSDANVTNSLRLSQSELSTGSVIIDFHGRLSALQSHALAYRDLSSRGSSAEAARALFDTLRWSEGVRGATRVFIAAIPPTSSSNGASITTEAEKGVTVMDMTLGLVDRIFRAASGVSVDLVVY